MPQYLASAPDRGEQSAYVPAHFTLKCCYAGEDAPIACLDIV